MAQLKEALEEMLRYYRLKSKVQRSRIKGLWEEAMGPVIARYTHDIRMNGRTLLVKVESAPLRQELAMGRDKIKDRLNELLGEPYIDEVVIR